MKFDDAAAVESICYDIRLADFPRGKNRERINNLFNGVPPFSEEDADKNNITINVNFLEGTVMSHEARAQFYSAFLSPGKYFNATTDLGPMHKRDIISNTVTQQMNKVMKRSMRYFETFRSKFAMNVLHGIGPANWRNRDEWCPRAVGIEDVGIPANTLLTMENLPFFYIYRSFTLPELIKLTSGPKLDRSWNMPLVKQCIEWIDKETQALMGQNWPEIWSPEKISERVKGDGGFYATDQVPTIDCFDFYFWNDDDKIQGWNRRIILDSWSTPQASGGAYMMTKNREVDFARNQFLFNSKTRKYASNLSELVSFQFADLSAVAPFRYHSVRSLGFLVYAACHLQNRIRCKFNESVFEALMNYYRVKSIDDVDRALKVDLINRGFVDETIQFIPPAERWQVNSELIAMGIGENARIIANNSAGNKQPDLQQEQGSKSSRKNSFQVMSEINQGTAMVSAAFNQAYKYQEAEYREIFRRFMKKNSSDPDVLAFRLACVKRDVPNYVFDADAWEIEPSRVMGGGNQTMQMAIAQQLLNMRNLFDPDPQRDILREATFAITGDADRAERWVPDEPLKISDSVHDAQLVMGVLMQGLPVALKTGQNHQEYVQVMLLELGMLIQKAEKSGGMAPPKDLEGFGLVAQHIQEHLKVLAQDKENKDFVSESAKQLGKLMNMVKAFVQRLQQKMQKQGGNGNGVPPEAIAKIKATQITAQAKAQNTRESHAQRTAQRQVAFEMEENRKQHEFEAEQRRLNMEAVHETNRNLLKSLGEGSETESKSE
jgi:hypothetical protein